MYYVVLALPNSIRNNRAESLILNSKKNQNRNQTLAMYFHIVISKPFVETSCLFILLEKRNPT